MVGHPKSQSGGNLGSALRGVSCTSSSNCVAVGDGFFNGNFGTLIEAWDGSSWSIVPSPNPINGLGYPRLNGVSCAGPSRCMAVGDYAYFTLIETWNGSAWSVVAGPSLTDPTELYSMSCSGAGSGRGSRLGYGLSSDK